MSKLLLGLALVTILGWTQQPMGQTRLTVPRFEKGVIEGKTYRNASLGLLAFTPDPSLTFERPDVKESGTKRESLMVAALARATSGSVREGTVFGAIALADYPQDQRSTDACMRKVVAAQLKDGFAAAVESSNSDLGHIMFARTDFFHKKPPAYEAVFVKACGALALTIVFAGHDRDTVEKFLATTALKLDLSVSGCGSPDK